MWLCSYHHHVHWRSDDVGLTVCKIMIWWWKVCDAHGNSSNETALWLRLPLASYRVPQNSVLMVMIPTAVVKAKRRKTTRKVEVMPNHIYRIIWSTHAETVNKRWLEISTCCVLKLWTASARNYCCTSLPICTVSCSGQCTENVTIE